MATQSSAPAPCAGGAPRPPPPPVLSPAQIRELSDRRRFLGIRPPERALTGFRRFTATQDTYLKIEGVNYKAMGAILKPRYPVVAIFSNQGMATLPGYEFVQEDKLRKKEARRNRRKKKNREVSGRSREPCFSWSVDMPVEIEVNGKKVMRFAKYFPKEIGCLQVPGVLCKDLSDGRRVIDAIVSLLAEQTGKPVEIHEPTHVIMRNFNFATPTDKDRVEIDLRSFVEKMEADPRRPFEFYEMSLKPFPNDVTFRYRPKIQRRRKKTKKFTDPRIQIYQSGKINFKGFYSEEEAVELYEFMNAVLLEGWFDLMVVTPRPRARATARTLKHKKIEDLADQMVSDVTVDLISRLTGLLGIA